MPNNLSRDSGPLFKEIAPSLMARLHTRGDYAVPGGKQIKRGVGAQKRGGRTKDSFFKEVSEMATGTSWGSRG